MMELKKKKEPKLGRLAMSAAAARAGLTNKLKLLDQVYHAQRALGGYKYREKYKCTDLELAQHLDQLHEQFRRGQVQLSILKQAVDSNPLIRFFVKRKSKRIAAELDRQDGRE